MTIIDLRNPEGAVLDSEVAATLVRAPVALPAVPAAASSLVSDFLVLANRLPVSFADGEAVRSPGGLVAALLPALSAGNGVWIGASGGHDAVPAEYEGVRLREVAIEPSDIDDYYDGFANNTLWPLYHDAIRKPTFNSAWWDAYVRVNQRFASAAVEAASPGAMVWVHDYHLQLVPEMLRARRPDLRIGFFLHIPFPPQELFMQLPWRKEILRGVLGADVVGFQEPIAASNFRRLARQVGANGRGHSLQYQDRVVQVGAFPVSIDLEPFETLASSDAVKERAIEIRQGLGSPEHVLLGVDRLDYTKGIDLRLRAFRELLEEGVLDPQKVVMVQIAVPSRENVHDYLCQREIVERMVGEINGSFARVGTTPVHYLHRSIPMEELVALYCAADVMLVTPLRDGMNLVAKEYVASRVDQHGSLVLSEFAGAARELAAADLVNPHDIEDMKVAITAALRRSRPMAARRMQRLRTAVRRHDVYHWTESFLGALRAVS
jgi:trehalose 6-phosphate synthase